MFNADNYISVSELARVLAMPRPTVYSNIGRGTFPSIKIAGRVLIQKADIPAIESMVETHRKFSNG